MSPERLVGELALTIKKLIDGGDHQFGLTRLPLDAEASGGEVSRLHRGPGVRRSARRMLDQARCRRAANPQTRDRRHLERSIRHLTDDDGNHLSPEILRFVIAASG
ncbi:MAG: hypothetical protein IPF42_16915 [Candidatus Microthrix sp.]|nr:hypothetical protein [Candidatus Microthrix sp.]